MSPTDRTDDGIGAPVGEHLRRARVLERRIDDGWMVLTPVGTEPTVLTGTAGEIWELLRQPRTLAELTDILAARYGVPPNEIRRDISPALDDLVRRDVLRST